MQRISLYYHERGGFSHLIKDDEEGQKSFSSFLNLVRLYEFIKEKFLWTLHNPLFCVDVGRVTHSLVKYLDGHTGTWDLGPDKTLCAWPCYDGK